MIAFVHLYINMQLAGKYWNLFYSHFVKWNIKTWLELEWMTKIP